MVWLLNLTVLLVVRESEVLEIPDIRVRTPSPEATEFFDFDRYENSFHIPPTAREKAQTFLDSITQRISQQEGSPKTNSPINPETSGDRLTVDMRIILGPDAENAPPELISLLNLLNFNGYELPINLDDPELRTPECSKRIGMYTALIEIFGASDNIKILGGLLEKQAPTAKELADMLLECAVGTCNVTLTEMLLHNGVCASSKHRRRIPLRTAIQFRNLDLVTLLLKHGADPNIKGDHSLSPLTLAVHEGHQEIVATLLQFGAELNETSTVTVSALQMAAATRNIEMLALLLKHCGDRAAELILSDSPTTLEIAAEQNMFDMMELVLEHMKGLCTLDNQLLCRVLCAASYGGSDELVHETLKAGADVNMIVRRARIVELRGTYITQSTPLEEAVWANNTTTIDCLLRAGAFPDPPLSSSLAFKSGSALQGAAYHRNIELVQHLLELGASVDAPLGSSNTFPDPKAPFRFGTVVEWAVLGGEINVLRLLLQNGGSANKPEKLQNALRIASKNQEAEMVELLTQYGAGVKYHNEPSTERARSSDDTAYISPNESMIDDMIKAEAGLRDSIALRMACENEDLELVEMLIEVNQSNVENFGGAILEAAVATGNKKIVKRLISAGFNVNDPVLDHFNSPCRNKESYDTCPSAIARAIRERDSGMVALLLKHGAQVNDIPNARAERYAGVWSSGTTTAFQFLDFSHKSSMNITQSLLRAGISVNIYFSFNVPTARPRRDSKRTLMLTPIQAAVIANNMELLDRKSVV